MLRVDLGRTDLALYRIEAKGHKAGKQRGMVLEYIRRKPESLQVIHSVDLLLLTTISVEN